MADRKATYNPAADKRWVQKNPEHRRYLSARTSARSFIRKHATTEDLDELAELMAERRKVLAEID